MLETDPDFAPATYSLALSYEQEGRYGEAIAECQKAINLFGPKTGFGSGALAHAYAISGRTAEARKILKDLVRQSKQRHVSPYRMALIHAGLGENDEAFDWLYKAVAERDERMVRVGIDRQLSTLRADPRFSKVLKDIGLTQ